MTTYSFPVAALFATTVIYGRLSADNELTACKAGGMSLVSLSVAGPALVLGLLVAMVSLLFLCFVVPVCTLRVEKVIYSNLAQARAEADRADAPDSVSRSTRFSPRRRGCRRRESVAAASSRWCCGADDRDGGKAPGKRAGLPRSEGVLDRVAGGHNDRSAAPRTTRSYLDVRLQRRVRFPRRFRGDAGGPRRNRVRADPDSVADQGRHEVHGHLALEAAVREPVEEPAGCREMVADLVRADQSAAFQTTLLGELNSPDAGATFEFEAGRSTSCIAIQMPRRPILARVTKWW